jgi:hypothetical protein
MNNQQINQHLKRALILALEQEARGNKEMATEILRLASKIALREIDRNKEAQKQDIDYWEAIQANQQEAESTGN